MNKDADSFGDLFTYLIDLSLQHSLNHPQSSVHSETSDDDMERTTTTTTSENTRSNELIDRGEFCIESVMESLYNY